jgi:hypothetical protein
MKYLLALLALVLLSACQPHTQTLIESVPHTEHELISSDAFATPFSSRTTTVLGVTVGMTEEDVLTKLGPADNTNEFDFGAIKNWEYSAKLGLNQTGIIYHFEQGKVTRIAVTKAMNPYLQGTAVINKTKDQIYSVYGTPERVYDVPGGRFYVYNDEGFEVYTSPAGEYQYAFVYPMRKLPSMAHITENKTQADILKVKLPVLLTDTTTLCDQGPTFGQNPATKECKAFTKACDIPDNWIEVRSCEATQ